MELSAGGEGKRKNGTLRARRSLGILKTPNMVHEVKAEPRKVNGDPDGATKTSRDPITCLARVGDIQATVIILAYDQ